MMTIQPPTQAQREQAIIGRVFVSLMVILVSLLRTSVLLCALLICRLFWRVVG